MTSAGTGIRHSEKAHGAKPVHFLQIWSLPSTQNLTPRYFTRSVLVFALVSPFVYSPLRYRHFTDAEKKDTLVRIVAPSGAEGVTEKREANGPAPVHSPLSLYATLLSPSKSISHTLAQSKAYIHVVQTSGYNPEKATGATVKVTSSDGAALELSEGDGAYVTAPAGTVLKGENVGDRVAEVLLFDLE